MAVGESKVGRGLTADKNQHSSSTDEHPLSSHPSSDRILPSARQPDAKSRVDGSDAVVDVEKGHVASIGPGIPSTGKERSSNFQQLYRRYRIVFHLLIWGLFTGWWIASLILHRNDKNWVIPFLFWLSITLRIFFLWIPVSTISKPMRWAWKHTGTRIYDLIPEKLRIVAGAALTISIIIVGAFASEESADNTRANRAVSLFGLAVFVSCFWASSQNRNAINWQTVIVGFLLQFVIALFVLRTGVGYDIFSFISSLATALLEFAKNGVAFLTSDEIAAYPYFFFSVLPAIIFFVALVQLLYYVGLIQWFVGKFAVFFFWAMHISGAEAVVAAATPFVGQGESAMLVKPFVPHLTLAEIHQVMTSGFATIAGSVLVAYIGLGVRGEILISSCVMSIPASISMSKLRYPETEESISAGQVIVPEEEEKAANAIHAFAKGAWLGLKLAGMILATLPLYHRSGWASSMGF